jgi:hypothetical protein
MAGTSVPLRLAEDDDEFEKGAYPGGPDDDWGVDANFYGSRGPDVHRRTGSGRSSDGSRQNTMAEPFNDRPLSEHSRSPSDLPQLDETTPIATTFQGRDYFLPPTRNELPGDSSPEDEEERERKEDELRRRGSVDDRAMTMSGVRLFVANPDLDD